MKINVAIPCVSVHKYYEQFRGLTDTPIIDLPQEIVSRLEREKVKKVLVLGSGGVDEMSNWKAFKDKDNLGLIFPPHEWQQRIDEMIIQIMRSPDIVGIAAELSEIISTASMEYDAVLVACSELSVLLDSVRLPANVFDSMELLAEAALREEEKAEKGGRSGETKQSRHPSTLQNPRTSLRNNITALLERIYVYEFPVYDEEGNIIGKDFVTRGGWLTRSKIE
jgi:hypothetical protein